MEKVFAIGDVHGEYTRFEHMLKQWNPDNQQLILLGDLIDRGEDSYRVVHLAKELKEKYGAVVLKANHEEMLLDWLKNPDLNAQFYYKYGGRETIHSFFKKKITFSSTPEAIANLMQSHFAVEIQFLKELPYYYEWNDYVFVHAGVDLRLDDWKTTNESDFCWIREDFHYEPNNTGKKFVFGHTPTCDLNIDRSYQVWVSPDQTKFGLDGGAVFGGLLHGMLIDGNEKTIFSLDKELQLTKGSLYVPFLPKGNS